MTAIAPAPAGRAASPGLRRVDPIASSEWDALVSSFPAATFFHHSAWAKVLRDAYGFQPFYLVGTNGGWAVPVMEVRSLLTGTRGVSLPFSDFCDPLVAGDSVPGRELLSELAAVGQPRGWRYLELHGGHALFPFAPAASTFFSHDLDLSGAEDALFEALDPAARRAIRRARDLGVVVRTGRLMEDVRAFYRLHCQTRRKHGLPPQPFRFFERLHEHVIAPGLGTVFLAFHDARVVAAAVFVHAHRHVTYKFGASDQHQLSLRPNNLLMWEAICHFRSAGYPRLSFGRTESENAGLRRFKLSWGAQESVQHYVRFDLHRNAFARAGFPATGWSQVLFRHLPLSLSRVCGKILYRHIA